MTIDQAAGQADPTNASQIDFTVVFSEAVTGFDGSDIDFTGSTAAGPLVASVTGTGPTYTVSVSGMTGDGDVVVAVVASAALDPAGNASTASTSTDNTVTHDATAPTMVSVQRWDPVAETTLPETTTATSVTFRITFSEDVLNLDPGDVVLTGAAGAFATATGLVAVTGASIFDLTVDVPLWANGALGLDLAPGVTIDDLAGNPLDAGVTPNPLEGYLIAHSMYCMVLNTADSGAGSLRAAITCANSSPGVQTIGFAIPGAGPHTIQPLSALPTINDPAIVDGTTQPGFAGAPVIELDGSLAGSGVSGLQLAVGGNTVRGLAINRFQANGILLQAGGGNTIQGNFLGTNPAGTVAAANGLSGIDVRTAGNTIGGAGTGEGNLISGNGQFGIVFLGAATNNTVLGNRIGTNPTGTSAVANGLYGVYVASANNQIGGPGGGEGNVISGNVRGGVAITGGAATGNRLQGNRIGTTADGTAAVANGNAGVTVSNAGGNTLGGTLAGAGNVLSGNALHGVMVVGASTNNLLQGNLIGLDAAGAAAVPNGQYGVTCYSPQNTIGGSDPGAGNTISGNTYSGVIIYTASATGVKVQGNRIGTDLAGTAAVPNEFYGVYINSTSNLIGGTAPGEGNQISGNTRGGVALTEKTAQGNVIQGNRIGTNPDGTAALANGGAGVTIAQGSNNTVGGAAAGAGNQISGNATQGVMVTGVDAKGNVIDGNLVGTDATGTAAVGNGQYGVAVYSGQNIIGAAGSGNTVSGNGTGGVLIYGANGNAVLGNRIGTAAAGSSLVANGGSGVMVLGSDNLVGGVAEGVGNTIAGNTSAGVYIAGAASTGNAVQGNSIFSNGGYGIDLAPLGSTGNDSDDADTGPNNLQNYPAMASAVLSGGTLTIGYSVPSAEALAAYPLAVEFFLADAAGQEGQRYLGGDAYVASGADSVSLAVSGVSIGQRLVATATDANGNTSEFSVSYVIAAGLQASAVADGGVTPAAPLDVAALTPLVGQAIAAWESAGLDAARVARLRAVAFEVADLPDRFLGWATPERIVLDADAAGWGWYVDGWADSGSPGSARDARLSVDLLTVVMHELGHVLGLADQNAEDELMGGVLRLGTRHLPTTTAVDQVLAGGDWLN